MTLFGSTKAAKPTAQLPGVGKNPGKRLRAAGVNNGLEAFYV